MFFSIEINNKFYNLYGNAKHLEYPNNSLKKIKGGGTYATCPRLYSYSN